MTSNKSNNNPNESDALTKADSQELAREEVMAMKVQIDAPPRERWGSKLDFILTTFGYVVGYGNFWRFPYLCYRNGGASFLFPYLLMLFLIGIPTFFMELSLGQWYDRGFIGIWKAVSPLSSGLGYATLFMQFISCCYYIIILAWVTFFLFDSFRSEVPWKYCENPWNTPFCRTERTGDQIVNCTEFNLPVNCSQTFNSPSGEYWNNQVLQITGSIEEMGSMRWELVGTLLLSWVITYVCIFKSIKLTGKIVYFTASFPIVVIVIMLIRGVTLDGAEQGIIFYLKPDFERLADPQVWVFAATQIYWSLGIGFGGILTFGSFNYFRNNIQRDSIIIATTNCATSIVAGFAVFSVIGFIAYTLRTTVDKLKNVSGPGLVFIVYPEAISQMPLSVLWAIIFFFMLVTLGLDTMFGAMEAFTTAIIDERANVLRRRKWLVLAVGCVAMFLFGLPFVMQGGMYVFNLFDYQAAGISLLLCVLLENIFVAWVFGIDQFSDDVEAMTGRKPYWFIRFSLKYVTPLISMAILLANIIQWNGIKYNKVPYPGWAEVIGWFLCLIPIFIVFGKAGYVLWKAPGSFKERWALVTTPDQQVRDEIEEKHGIRRPRKYFL